MVPAILWGWKLVPLGFPTAEDLTEMCPNSAMTLPDKKAKQAAENPSGTC